MEGHLERDFGRRRAVGSVETMPEFAAGERRQAFGQLDHRPMREAGEDDVLQFLELLAQRCIDSRVAVAEQVDPPGADAVQVTPAIEVVQPDTVATGDRHQRQALDRRRVLLHLCAGVPDRSQAALQQIAIAHDRWWAALQCSVCDGALFCSGISACTVSPSLLG
jgi:hypothetical protein